MLRAVWLRGAGRGLRGQVEIAAAAARAALVALVGGVLREEAVRLRLELLKVVGVLGDKTEKD